MTDRWRFPSGGSEPGYKILFLTHSDIVSIGRVEFLYLPRSSKHAAERVDGASRAWVVGGCCCQAKGLSDFKIEASGSWQPLPFMCSVWLSML